jgi:hypothetical protein
MSGWRIGAVAVALVVLAAAARTSDDAVAPPVPLAVHSDPEGMVQGVLQALDALLRNDLPAVGPAVKRIEAGCRTLFPEEDSLQGDGVRNRDQALHKVLTGTRLYASHRQADAAFEEFVWVLRTCRECHALARAGGRLPAEGALWDPLHDRGPDEPSAETAGSPNGAP